MSTDWKKSPLSDYSVHKVGENEGGFNFYCYLHSMGQVIIMREKIDGTEIDYANGGFDLTSAWANRATLAYKELSKI